LFRISLCFAFVSLIFAFIFALLFALSCVLWLYQ